ncbi:conjugal transfer protein TrbH [Rhizobium sp. P40RR-XXII]|uniref:conjugal transfer protein TrbH n=1 Tax=Rhizobium sp. P40RR-XXII TaxID=2726739 RepID=UPI00145771C4|nr:conjugal transfer protein TrbH [Rhizobium sp. P40RR-XXII]NLS20286.1 conjugal transfer protein TrbH [Rhizobium sp. P40RR-XXII]
MRPLFLRRIRSFGLAVALLLLASGCQSLGPGGLVTSRASADIPAAAATAIASDMANRFTEHVDPSSGAIGLKQDGSPFGQALEAALKGRGYAVISNQKTDGSGAIIPLAYVVEPFEGQVLARLSTKDVELSRAYTVNGGGASPTSPLSVMRRG